MNLIELKEAIEKKFTDEFKLIDLANFVEKNKNKYADFLYIFNERKLYRNAYLNEYEYTDVSFTILEDIENNEEMTISVELRKIRENDKNNICVLNDIEINKLYK